MSTSAPFGSPSPPFRRRDVRVLTCGMFSVSIGRGDIALVVAWCPQYVLSQRRGDLRCHRSLRLQRARVPRVTALLEHDVPVDYPTQRRGHTLIAPGDVVVLREDRHATILL